MKFLLAVDHLSLYNGKGYEYYEMEAKNITTAKAKVLFNFHKFDQTYLIKILKPSCYGYLLICNVRSPGEIEAIGKGTPAYYHWAVEERKIKSFDSYLEDWEDWEKIIEKNRLRYLKEKKVQKIAPPTINWEI